MVYFLHLDFDNNDSYYFYSYSNVGGDVYVPTYQITVTKEPFELYESFYQAANTIINLEYVLARNPTQIYCQDYDYLVYDSVTINMGVIPDVPVFNSYRESVPIIHE